MKEQTHVTLKATEESWTKGGEHALKNKKKTKKKLWYINTLNDVRGSGN